MLQLSYRSLITTHLVLCVRVLSARPRLQASVLWRVRPCAFDCISLVQLGLDHNELFGCTNSIHTDRSYYPIERDELQPHPPVSLSHFFIARPTLYLFAFNNSHRACIRLNGLNRVVRALYAIIRKWPDRTYKISDHIYGL
ncbi:hypothetical protein CRM22_001069 [Opisthorchis felineus]|uniref:Uncharacterized protein n=1 Tax=Opisthorchis felineus TaxID=147828 RepID=A0A4S2MC96_OPIFE|nr:hypothetical protein CRM22_001069 [Opisthorchis felineus]